MPNSHIKPSMSQNQLLSLSSMATLLFRLLKPEAKTLVSFLTRLSHKLYPIHQQTLLTQLQNIPRIQLVPASTAATLIWPPSFCSDYCKSFSLVSLLLPLPVPLSVDSQLVPTAQTDQVKARQITPLLTPLHWLLQPFHSADCISSHTSLPQSSLATAALRRF